MDSALVVFLALGLSPKSLEHVVLRPTNQSE